MTTDGDFVMEMEAGMSKEKAPLTKPKPLVSYEYPGRRADMLAQIDADLRAAGYQFVPDIETRRASWMRWLRSRATPAIAARLVPESVSQGYWLDDYVRRVKHWVGPLGEINMTFHGGDAPDPTPAPAPLTREQAEAQIEPILAWPDAVQALLLQMLFAGGWDRTEVEKTLRAAGWWLVGRGL